MNVTTLDQSIYVITYEDETVVATTETNDPITYIEDVIAGTNISIDKTDPKKPIISSTGGAMRVQSVTSAATVTPNADADDMVKITAQAENLTIANPIGTPTDGQMIIIRVKGTGSAYTITYGDEYRAIGITLPTLTLVNKTLYLAIIRNETDTKWDGIGERQEA